MPETATLERPALEAPFILTLAAEAVAETDDGDWIVEGYAATSDLDLQGDIIKPEALDKAAAGAVGLTVLLNHDQNQIIGKVVDARAVRDGGQGKLWVKVEISKEEKKLWSKIRKGILNKFSVRGKVDRAHRKFDRTSNQSVNIVEELRLLEISLVAVPANPKALAITAYVTKALTEFIEGGGEIPEDEETKMNDRDLWGLFQASCVESGIPQPFFEVEVPEDASDEDVKALLDKRHVALKTAYASSVGMDVEKADDKYPYSYPKPKPKAKKGGKVEDMLTKLKGMVKDNKGAVALIDEIVDALGKYPEPKAKDDNKPASDVPKSKEKAKGEGEPEPESAPQEPAPAVTVEDMKPVLDAALEKRLKALEAIVAAAPVADDDKRFTRKEVFQIVAGVLGIKKEE